MIGLYGGIGIALANNDGAARFFIHQYDRANHVGHQCVEQLRRLTFTNQARRSSCRMRSITVSALPP